MELKALKTREIGLFSKRVYVGRYFAEKGLEDFTKSKDQKKNQEEYEKYLDDEHEKAYVIMREPTTPEAKLMSVPEVPAEVIARMDPDKQVAFYEAKGTKEEKRSSEMMDLIKSCIVGHNFTNDGAKATLEEVREMCYNSSALVGYLIQEWMKSSVNFPKPREEN